MKLFWQKTSFKIHNLVKAYDFLIKQKVSENWWPASVIFAKKFQLSECRKIPDIVNNICWKRCIYFWTVKYICFWFLLIDLISLSLAASFSLNSLVATRTHNRYLPTRIKIWDDDESKQNHTQALVPL